MTEKLAYTIPEAAEVLGISAGQVRRMCTAGTLPTIRIGSRVLLPVRALGEWVDSQTRASA